MIGLKAERNGALKGLEFLRNEDRKMSKNILLFVLACLITTGFHSVAYGQIDTQCAKVENDADCLFSETPVPGVHIVRQKDYSRRPANYLFNDTYVTLAGARETNNHYNAFDFQVPPGGGPLPHTHGFEWEIFFVDQGTITFEHVDPNPPFNLMLHDAPTGTLVYGPQCPVHGFLNRTPAPARIFSFTLPAGLDAFFTLTGKPVLKYGDPAPPVTPDDIQRLAFWGEKFNGMVWFPNSPPPSCPGAPPMLQTSITDSSRPKEVGPFGESRVVLMTPAEVGNTTGAVAFCGPGAPGRPGGTVKYSYFSLPGQKEFPTSTVSGNSGVVFYTLDGTLTFLFNNDQRKIVQVEPLTYVAIDPGVTFSIANLAQGGQQRAPARSLVVDVISPACR